MMADAPVVHIGENSPEQVAYQLMARIAHAEELALHGVTGKRANREWILSTYAECLKVVRTAAHGKA